MSHVPSNDVTLAPLDDKREYSLMLARSTLINDAYRGQPANLLVAVEYGAALGIPAMQAISSINVIKGKPTLSAELMSALVRRAGHKLRVQEFTSPLSVRADLIRKDDPDFTFTAVWDMDKARTAGVLGKTGSGWEKYPNQMLRARAITEVCRQGAADALAGFVYAPEDFDVHLDTDDAVDTPTVTVLDTMPPPAQQSQATPVAERVEMFNWAGQVLNWTDGQRDAAIKHGAGGRVDRVEDMTDEEWARIESVLLSRQEIRDALAGQVEDAEVVVE